MYVQKDIINPRNKTPIQYRTNEYIYPNTRIVYQGPKIYREEIFYEYEPDSYQVHSAIDINKQLEINNEEIPNSKIYAIRSEINSTNKKISSNQLFKDKTFNHSFHKLYTNFKEEREPSPKTINIGDTKESIETNYRNIHTRRSPIIRRNFISKKDNFYDQNDFIEYRNDSFDENRNYYTKRKIINNYYERPRDYIIRRGYEEYSPLNYMERSGSKIIDTRDSGYFHNEEQMSPYNNLDDLNTSHDFERTISDNNNNKRQTFGENNSYENDINRQNRFDNMSRQFINRENIIQRNRNINGYYTYNNKNQNYQYQKQIPMSQTNRLSNNIMNNTTMSFAPRQSKKKYIFNNSTYLKDDIKDKYVNQSYNNMTYADIKKIVNKFTKVYDPKKNNQGLLVEDTQVILPGAEDEVFMNRHRVLTKTRRLSNIILSKQKNRQSTSKKNTEEDQFYKINNNYYNPRTSNNFYYGENEINNDNEINSENEYNIRTVNIIQSDKKSKTPIKGINRKSKNHRYQYLSLAMMTSKGVNTEDRIILRRERSEKGGVVDLGSMEKRRGRYKIRKVSRSPGYNRSLYFRNNKNRAKAAKTIQEWWRKRKELISIKIMKIIKIQSIYRGRFVRKYLYDLLYLNYLYLSFCQKIEMVLKRKIKPYIFNIIKNYGKLPSITSEDIKDFDVLKNIMASKEKKWKILNLRKGMNQLHKYLRKQEKITLVLYKLLKIKAEKYNNNAILRNALRKWNYITKIGLNKNINIVDENKIDEVIKNQNDKIKGLFNIINGINQFSKKSALDKTLPKLNKYLKEQKLKNILRKLINGKSIYNKEKLKEYFYRYIKMTLKNLNEKEKEKEENIKVRNQKIYIPKKEKIKIHEIESNENIDLIGKEKGKDDIIKMKGRLFLHLINSENKKQNKNLLRKYFNKYFKKIIQIQRKEDRKLFEEKQKEENDKFEEERENEKLRINRKLKLIPLPKIKENFNKNLLKKYFDIWKKNTFSNKESSLKLFIKILDIIIENYNRKLIHKKLNQWKQKVPQKIPIKPKKTKIKTIEKSIGVSIPIPQEQSKEKLQPQPQEPEFDIFNTLKNLKDIINFNDYLRNIYVNKYGKEFLNNLDKTRNPKLINKSLRKLLRKKNYINKINLRKALNTWKNNIDIEKALKNLKTKLIYTLYNKNRNNFASNTLQKYFDRWKNINTVGKIKDEINNLKNSQKMVKNLLLKNMIRNKDYNNKNIILKTYLNKWKSFNANILNNNNKKNALLRNIIPKRNQKEKMLLYKYLSKWRNKVNENNHKNIIDNIYNNYRKNILNIFLNKNDKHNLAKAFNKWRYNKKEKIPINAYSAGIKKIRNLFLRKPFNDFKNIMGITDPSKYETMDNILNKIYKEKPYNKLINNMRTLIKENKLRNVLPKVDEKMKEFYLPEYFNKWKNNAKELRIKNMMIITKWLKRKHEIEKDKNLKRRNELLKHIINNKIKSNKYSLKFPLRFWKRIASIMTDNIKAKTIQKFWRGYLGKKKVDKLNNQNKLRNILLNLYRKNYLNEITEPEQCQEVNDYLITKEENKDKLRKIFDDINNTNNKLLLRLAIKKWNEDKPLFDKNLQLLQNNIRILLSKNKLNNKKLLQNKLNNIFKTNEAKDNKLLKDKFIQWYIIAKKLNYHDTSKIEEFIRKIAIGRLIKKLQCTLDKYINKYFIYLLNNIAKLNILKNTLKKKPNQIAMDEIREYIRKNDIVDLLENITNNENDKYNNLLKKKYLDKWRDKINEINNKENEGAIMIQKILRGKKIKDKIDRKLNIKKILTKIVNRYDNNSQLNLYFKRWGRITKKLLCNENARVIQKFCRKIHYKYLRLKKQKNIPNYKNLANKLISLGSIPKRDFFDNLYNIYKNKKLEELGENLDDKRKDILKDALDNIKYRNKLILLKNIFDDKDKRIKYILKMCLNKWKNKAFNNKYVLLALTNFCKNKEKTNNNILRSILYTWLYKAMLLKVKNKEKIISSFCRDISRKKYITSKWKHLFELLRNQMYKDDILDISDNLKVYKNLDILFNIIDNHMKKDAMHDLKKNNYILIFKEKIEDICSRLDEKENGINLKRYFDRWKNKTKKINDRLDKLEELMDLLDLKQKRDDTNTLSNAMLVKKLFNDIPKFKKLNALYKIEDFANNKYNNERLSEDLIDAKNEIKPQLISPLIEKIYKVYAYKVLDNLYDTINKGLKRTADNNKNNFMGKMLLNYSDKYKDYNYSNKMEKENKPYTKKILFKSKKNPKQQYIPDKSNLQLQLITPLVNLLDNLIKKKKKDTFDNLYNNYRTRKFIDTITNYVQEKENPNYQEFIDILKLLKDKYENDGPQKEKLFKLLRKYIIKNIFLYKKDIYRRKLIFYLIHLTRFNLEISKARWLRQMIRKWRFIYFVRKMTKQKMELMYKNLHVSYLEMVNSLFSDEESTNPGVAKEFERFGNGIGMFINEDPYNSYDENLCLGIKKQYLFPSHNLDLEKVGEIRGKVEGKKIMVGKTYVKNLDEAKEGDIIIDNKDEDNKYVKEDEKLENDNEEGEEEEDEKDNQN